MASVTITIEQLTAELNRTAEQVEKAFRSESLRKKISILATSGVKDNFAKGQSPDGTPWPVPKMRSGKPLLDTGRMRASITGQVTAQGASVGTSSIQAGIHNSGGVIRAKKRFLAIPLTTEARRAGSPRNMADLHFEGKKGANKGVLANPDGEAIFALVPSVVIPKREFLGFSAKTLDQIERLIGDEIARVIGGG